MQKMNEKCYAKCVPKPGASLSSSEEGCLSRCSDRYLEACKLRLRARAACPVSSHPATLTTSVLTLCLCTTT